MDMEAMAFAETETLASACRENTPAQTLEQLTEQICVFDTQSIVTFGSGAAAEVAQASDGVLRTIRGSQLSDPAPLLESLGRVMGGFDPEELTGEKKKGFFRKKAGSTDQILEKYRKMGEEVDRAYVSMKRYEAEIQTLDQKLKALFDSTFRTYRRLVEFIQAGEQGCGEIREHLTNMESSLLRNPGDAALQMDRDSLRHALTLLERRVQDLRVNEILALQSLPAIQTMRRNNLGLIQKIDTAFLVTLPVFRQALGQALARKRQQLQNQAMEALERRTRTALQQRPDSGGQSQEELEAAWHTIMDGIAQLQALRKNANVQQSAQENRLAAALREQTGSADEIS